MNAVDTNVLVYACDARDPERRDRVRAIMDGLPAPVLLWQVACEFIAASRKPRVPGLHRPSRVGPALGTLRSLEARDS